MKLLVSKGCALRGALHACGSNMLLVKWLVENYGIIGEENHDGQNLLSVACEKDYIHVAQFFLERGLKTACPFHHAFSTEMAQVFLDKGYSLEEHDSNGQTGLHKCVQYYWNSFSKLYIKAGANVNALDNSDRTPLDLCRDESKRMLLRRHGGLCGAEYIAFLQSGVTWKEISAPLKLESNFAAITKYASEFEAKRNSGILAALQSDDFSFLKQENLRPDLKVLDRDLLFLSQFYGSKKCERLLNFRLQLFGLGKLVLEVDQDFKSKSSTTRSKVHDL